MGGTWDLVRSWLTLPVVFVVVNMVIGTIAVTSAWWKARNPNANGRPSPFTRLLSGSFSRRALATGENDLPWNSFKPQDGHVEPGEEQEPQGTARQAALATGENDLPWNSFQPQDGHVEPGEEQEPQGTARQAADGGTRAGQQPLEDIREVPERGEEVASAGAGIEPRTLTQRAVRAPRLGKSKSDSPTGELLPPPPPPPGVKKSGSFDSIFSGAGASPLDLGVPAKVEGGASATAEVDAEAEDFIQRFKNQLKLQRLQSILRYKEMIDRGK